jgi:hypothetical protein
MPYVPMQVKESVINVREMMRETTDARSGGLQAVKVTPTNDESAEGQSCLFRWIHNKN